MWAMWTRIWWVRPVSSQLHQRAGTAGTYHPVAGAGGLPLRVHPPSQERAGGTPDGGVYDSLGGVGRPVAHRQVDPAESAGVKLAFQLFLTIGVLGHHQQAGGAFVQSVDRVEARPLPVFPVAGHEEVAHRVVKVAVAGVDQHPGGFVDHHQVFVLIDEVQRAGAGEGLAGAVRVDSRTDSTCPAATRKRTFTRAPSTVMPSESHFTRRSTVPDRPR